MFNSSTYAVTLYTPPVVYTPGSTISGEVEIDFRQLQEEKIEAVFVHLRGSFKTYVSIIIQQYALSPGKPTLTLFS